MKHTFRLSSVLVEECQKISINSLDLNSCEEKITSIYIDYFPIKVTTTPCNYGGFRYWFICPQCGKRIGTLYRKPITTMYACRQCQNLTYALTQYSGTGDEKYLRRLNELKS